MVANPERVTAARFPRRGEVSPGAGSPDRSFNTSPAAVRISMAETLSEVRPYPSAREPQALLPIIPPMVQRVWLEGSGPNRNPWGTVARLQHRLDDAWFDDRGAAVWVDGQNPVHVAAEIHHHPGPDGVARDGCSGAPGGHRHPLAPADINYGGYLVAMGGKHHSRGCHAVQGCVGRVGRSAGGVHADVADARGTQRIPQGLDLFCGGHVMTC